MREASHNRLLKKGCKTDVEKVPESMLRNIKLCLRLYYLNKYVRRIYYVCMYVYYLNKYVRQSPQRGASSLFAFRPDLQQTL